MHRPVEPQHSFPQRILAICLACVISTGIFPASALPSPAAQLPVGVAFHVYPLPLPQGAGGPQAQQPPSPTPPEEQREKDNNWGEITVAQPKIWQYERVNSLLDGLLRDVQGVSLSDLTNLDPNAPNGAAVKFVQSMLEIGVEYDQAAGVTNKLALQNYAASQNSASAQISANNTYLQQLYQQRTAITGQLQTAALQDATLQGQLASTDPTTTAYTSLTTQEKAAAAEVSGLQTQLSSINTQITTASATTTLPPVPTLSTPMPTSPETANTFSSFLGNLPTNLTNNIVSELQSPSYPATKRLDNFITLLYERLAREISVLQDDVMRDPENVPFLMQFDVGLYPSSLAKNHVGLVEFTMNCDGCKVYSIYPGQSSYNLANYEGTSKRYSIVGALLTIIGFGITGDYRQQTDTLHGDLVQSVYMSGFEEGAESTDRAGKTSQQRFGWYYGSAPFEQLVTPGVRSTFALVSIPRRLLKDCYENTPDYPPSDPKDLKPCIGGVDGIPSEIGAKDISLSLTAHADWVKRNDPYYQKAHWYESKDYVGNINSPTKDHELNVIIPGTAAIMTTPDIVLTERERLHVLGIEYNTVYLPATTKPGTTPPATTPTPGTTQATATGTGPGTATVTISSAGTATASSTGGGGSTANATATAPPAAATASAAPSPPDAFTGCPKNTCASVLIKLGEPVDPNLVVTVKGEPLRRVRDWRGRGTSILPPAQSASDIQPPAAGTSTTGQPQRSENVTSASLLEADQLGPNTWMEVDSHRLLINVSQDLAGTEDFPPIQIIDPARRALFLPLDLDEGFSEVILNGFHLPTRNKGELKDYVRNHFFAEPGLSQVNSELKLQPTGPYPYETFSPLFLTEPNPQQIYAYLGETGVQILIGFLSDSDSAGSEGTQKPPRWLSSKTQVILEDRDLDLGWSLSCDPQGAELACDVPLQEIRTAYQIASDACNADQNNFHKCPSVAVGLANFPSISTLEVSVEQYDPEGDDSFYTPSPAKLSRFPVAQAKNTDAPDVKFSPWHFEDVSPTQVTLTGCNYPDFDYPNDTISVLGTHIPAAYRDPPVTQTPDQFDSDCASFSIPTIALTHPEVVIEYETSADNVTSGNTPTGIPLSLPSARFRPTFMTPIVVPGLNPSTTFAINQWTIDIPTGHVDCNDKLDILNGSNNLSAKWRIGSMSLDVKKITEVSTGTCTSELNHVIEVQAKTNGVTAQAALKTAKTNEEKAKANADLQAANQLEAQAAAGTADVPDWTEASKNSEIVLELVIQKSDLIGLPLKRRIQILRGKNLNWVGNLPDLRSLLLPSKLTVVSAGPNQFALEGDGAEAIDAVSLQGPGGTINSVSVASGSQIALVTLPSQPAKTTSPPTTKPSISGFSPGTNTGSIGSALTIDGKNLGTTAGPVVFTSAPGAASVTVTPSAACWNPTSIKVNVPPGTQTGTVTVKIGTTTYKSPKPFTVAGNPVNPAATLDCKAASPPAPASDQPGGNNSGNNVVKAGTYTVVPIVSWKDTTGKHQYLPLEVTDPQGKPLTYTVADTTQKQTTTDTSGAQVGPATTLTIAKKTTQTAPPKTSAATTGQ